MLCPLINFTDDEFRNFLLVDKNASLQYLTIDKKENLSKRQEIDKMSSNLNEMPDIL